MNIFRHAIPDAAPDDVIAWAEANVKVNGGQTSFDSLRTPQIVEPIRAMAHDPGLMIGTLVKPVQIGGSTAGEVLAAYWAAFWRGLFQLNWEDDQKAVDRWKDRLLPALQSCKDIRFSRERFQSTICELRLPNIILRCQGVFVESHLDSDTVDLQINEEIHSWKPGHLAKARARQTQVWNRKAFDISNAGLIGGQLHSAYEDGTMEQWEVACPGCGLYHVMRTRWEETRPDLGGLRYDTEGCKMDNGRFNYNKLEKTLRYQMPCGYVVHDNPVERRALKGRYSKPQNEGAHISHRSWNFEAVSCVSIRWLDIVREKHAALRALKAGDSEPWMRYITERECRFYSPADRPQTAIVLTVKAQKSREGLAERACRAWGGDKQKGWRRMGELSHYWLVIRDVMPNADSRLCWEGLVQTDADFVARLTEHGVGAYSCSRGRNHDFRMKQPGNCSACGNPLIQSFPVGCIDATYDRDNVLQFCYRSGMSAIHVSPQKDFFYHREEKTYRIWSEPKPIHLLLNAPPKFDYQLIYNAQTKQHEPKPHADEPKLFSGHQIGMLKLLFFLREHDSRIKANGGTGGILHEVPSDVSEDYKTHQSAWEYVVNKQGGSHATVEQLRKVTGEHGPDHTLMCEAYIAATIAQYGLLGNRLAELGLGDGIIGGKEK